MGWLFLNVIPLLSAITAFGGILLVMACFVTATCNALEQPQASREVDQTAFYCQQRASVLVNPAQFGTVTVALMRLTQ